jgi:hypothetical protein
MCCTSSIPYWRCRTCYTSCCQYATERTITTAATAAATSTDSSTVAAPSYVFHQRYLCCDRSCSRYVLPPLLSLLLAMALNSSALLPLNITTTATTATATAVLSSTVTVDCCYVHVATSTKLLQNITPITTATANAVVGAHLAP